MTKAEKIKASQTKLVEWAQKHHPRKMKAYVDSDWKTRVRRASFLWRMHGDA